MEFLLIMLRGGLDALQAYILAHTLTCRSCTVLPLFAGIRQRGAGLGPAVAFLYTAPATNILAIIYTGSLIGFDLALARIILSVSFASLIGMIVSVSFKSEG